MSNCLLTGEVRDIQELPPNHPLAGLRHCFSHIGDVFWNSGAKTPRTLLLKQQSDLLKCSHLNVVSGFPVLGALKANLGGHGLHESDVAEQAHLLKGLSSSDQLFSAWCTPVHMVQLEEKQVLGHKQDLLVMLLFHNIY